MTQTHSVFEALRKARGILVVKLGPLIGRSPAWGQRILDGSCIPKMADALALLRTLGAPPEQTHAVLEELCLRLLRQQGFSDRSIARARPLLAQAIAIIVSDSP